MAFVYVFAAEGRTKIGLANKVEHRRGNLEKAMGAPVVLRGFREFPSRDVAGQAERLMHKRFSSDRILGEWFTTPPEVVLVALAALPEPAPLVIVPRDGPVASLPDETELALAHLDRCLERAKAKRRAA